jgi:hypothetical protein
VYGVNPNIKLGSWPLWGHTARLQRTKIDK